MSTTTNLKNTFGLTPYQSTTANNCAQTVAIVGINIALLGISLSISPLAFVGATALSVAFWVYAMSELNKALKIEREKAAAKKIVDAVFEPMHMQMSIIQDDIEDVKETHKIIAANIEAIKNGK